MKSQAPFVDHVRIGRSGTRALALVARCPNVPTDVVAALLHLQHERSATQLLRRLEHAGLVRSRLLDPGAIVGGGTVRLWSLTPRGAVVLDQERGSANDGVADPARHSRLRATPMLVLTYRLLAAAVCVGPDSARVVSFEHPWIRRVTLPPPEARESYIYRLRPPLRG